MSIYVLVKETIMVSGHGETRPLLELLSYRYFNSEEDARHYAKIEPKLWAYKVVKLSLWELNPK